MDYDVTGRRSVLEELWQRSCGRGGPLRFQRLCEAACDETRRTRLRCSRRLLGDALPGVGSVFFVALNTCSTLLASAHHSRLVKVFDFSTERMPLVRELRAHRSSPICLAFHQSNPHLLASGSTTFEVIVWDVLSEALVWISRGEQSVPVISLTFDGGSAVVFCGSDSAVRLVDYSPEASPTAQSSQLSRKCVWMHLCLARGFLYVALVAGDAAAKTADVLRAPSERLLPQHWHLLEHCLQPVALACSRTFNNDFAISHDGSMLLCRQHGVTPGLGYPLVVSLAPGTVGHRLWALPEKPADLTAQFSRSGRFVVGVCQPTARAADCSVAVYRLVKASAKAAPRTVCVPDMFADRINCFCLSGDFDVVLGTERGQLIRLSSTAAGQPQPSPS